MMIDPLTGTVLLIIAAVALVFGQRNLDNLPVETEGDGDDNS